MKYYVRGVLISILLVIVFLGAIGAQAAVLKIEYPQKASFDNGDLVKIKGKSTIYIIYNKERNPIRSKTDFNKLGFKDFDVRVVKAADLKSYKVGERVSFVSVQEGSLIKTKGDTAVYLIEDAYRRPLSSPQIFTKRDYNWKDVKLVHRVQFERYPLGAPVTLQERRDGQIVKTAYSPKIYLLENGKKRPIVSPQAFETKGFQWNKVKTISKKELDTYPLGNIVTENDKPELAAVSSCDDLVRLIKQREYEYLDWSRDGISAGPLLGLESTPAVAVTESLVREYSTTNIQVQGVDEADIVKSDGTYLYALSFGSIVISQGFPTEQARKLSIIPHKEDFMPSEMFVFQDRLVVIGSVGEFQDRDLVDIFKFDPMFLGTVQHLRDKTRVYVYDIFDRTRPSLKRTLEFDGSYQTSRLIEDELYFVLNSRPPYKIFSETKPQGSELLPKYQEAYQDKALSEPKSITQCQNIQYINPVRENSYVTIVNLNILDDPRPQNSLVILGDVDKTYVSNSFMYLARSQHNPTEKNAVLSHDQTNIYRIQLTPNKLSIIGSAFVPGRVLNQFSMDEWDGHFRIATTAIRSKFGKHESSNVYVFNKDMIKVGMVENLAPGEEIYTARFLGSKGFLVTFERIDPFFSLDLSDHANPRLVGELKIPGFSTYLHPYDENHIIGLGENTDDPEIGTTRGIKLALFDLTDFANPKQMYAIVAASGDAASIAGKDHHAFLFDQSKNLLVIPVTEHISDSVSGSRVIRHDAFVYRLTLENGFELKTRISHLPQGFINMEYQSPGDYILRSHYIGNFLYTYSPSKWKITSLDTYIKASEIQLNDFAVLFKDELNKKVKCKPGEELCENPISGSWERF